MAPSSFVRFGSYSLDLANAVLLRDGVEVPLRRKSLDVLMVLARARGQLVTRSELIERVWADVSVQDETLNTSISEIRRAIGDPRPRSLYLQTVHGRGFRFVAAIGAAIVEPDWAPPLVGRAHELARLSLALDQAIRGRLSLVAISGEAGIGKTRLLEELARVAEGQGVLTLRAEGQDASRHSLFWIWSQLLRAYAASQDRQSVLETLRPFAGEVSTIAPSLGPMLGHVGSGVFEPGIVNARFFDAMIAILERIAGERPLLIALDDLHRASDSSLALLESTVSSLSDARILIILAFRDAEQREHSGLTRILNHWDRLGRLERLPLAPLSSPETVALMRSVSPGSLPEVLVQRIAIDTGGNPYYALEIASAIHANGARLNDIYAIPAGVRAALHSQLDLASADARQLLRATAIIGLAADVQLAAAVAGTDHANLGACVTQLVRLGILLDDPEHPEMVRFPHELLHEVVLSEISAPERARLQARMARAPQTKA